MSISEMMSKCVVECTEDATLEQVYDAIQKCEHGLVVIIDSEAHRVPIGVVSERSICQNIIGRGKNPRGLTAGSVLDSRIRTVRETDEVSQISVKAAGSLAAIIVTDDKRQVCGVIPGNRIPVVSNTVAATQSTGSIYVNTSVRQSPGVSEIPAFGWIH